MKTVHLAALTLLLAGSAGADTGTVSMILTLEGHKGVEPPVLQRGEVSVYEGKERDRVTSLVRAEGGQAGLQLAVLIDDGADTSLGSQLRDIKQFLTGQPASTEIEVGYIRNGEVRVSQDWTADHALAAKALRLPLGTAGIAASPYIALSNLIKKWPETPKRREVVLISSGIDLYGAPGPDNPYLNRAIADSQRAGVLVHTIYFGNEGHWGHSLWRINWGQNYLSQLSEETGGEAYWQGQINPVSLMPYFEDLSRKLSHQYRVTFVPAAEKKSGLQQVKIRTEAEHLDVLSADKVYVPGQ